jgi:hypothetical protein
MYTLYVTFRSAASGNHSAYCRQVYTLYISIRYTPCTVPSALHPVHCLQIYTLYSTFSSTSCTLSTDIHPVQYLQLYTLYIVYRYTPSLFYSQYGVHNIKLVVTDKIIRNRHQSVIREWPEIDFFLNNQKDALIIQIYSVIKFYMFRASSLPIISRSLLCSRHW